MFNLLESDRLNEVTAYCIDFQNLSRDCNQGIVLGQSPAYRVFDYHRPTVRLRNRRSSRRAR